MTSKQKAYQQQSRKSVQTKRSRPAKRQPTRDEGDSQFANFPPQATIDNVSQSSVVQAKLQIGEVGDKYEQEADRVAKATVEQINAPEAQQVQRDILPQSEEELQMKPLAEKQVLQAKSIPTISPLNTPKISLQAKGVGGGETSQDLEANINSAKSGGQSLAPDLQAKMGRAMGADFSNVKVHADSQSDSLNQSLQAKAFTTGQHIFFKKSEYNPASKGGQELIAHELTHVVQQNSNAVQCKEDTIVQRLGIKKKPNKENVKLLLPFLRTSSAIKKKALRDIQVTDFVDLGQDRLSAPIKDLGLFKAMSWFCGTEFSTENTNTILLIRAMRDDSLDQLMAVIERINPKMHDYKYQRYLPRASYYFGGTPEDVNLPSSVSNTLFEHYTIIRNMTHDENDKRRSSDDWDIDLMVDTQIAMLHDFEPVKRQLFSLLGDTKTRFTSNVDITQAASLVKSLGKIPGGAMKARILGGYNESGGPTTRKRR
ncbi:MAG: DUF4157 domain-containing protein [Cyanobacteria bacterium P01_E01_bin.42]